MIYKKKFEICSNFWRSKKLMFYHSSLAMRRWNNLCIARTCWRQGLTAMCAMLCYTHLSSLHVDVRYCQLSLSSKNTQYFGVHFELISGVCIQLRMVTYNFMSVCYAHLIVVTCLLEQSLITNECRFPKEGPSNLFRNEIDFRTHTFAWGSSSNQFHFIGLSFLVKRQEILSVSTRMKLHD